MSDTDQANEAVEQLEFIERGDTDRPGFDRRAFLRRTALTGAAAASVSTILSACGAAAAPSSGAKSIFASSTSYKFTFVNHVTTNAFFVPTQYGIQDACKLLGCSYAWTGSESSNIGQMVNSINAAAAAKVDGIATTLISLTAFNAPVEKALSEGIPVVAYNADAKGNKRLAYIGQNLELAGEEMGEHIAELVPEGEVALFIATPGALNLQPRINGALKTLAKHPAIAPKEIATGALEAAELKVIEAYLVGHPKLKGMFAVDGGDTANVALTIAKHGISATMKGGGFDMLEATQKGLAAGDIEFTIDQQPYLQGFLPVLELYLYNVSKHLSGIADVDTGLKFLDKETIQPYVTTKSRYEGTSSKAGVS